MSIENHLKITIFINRDIDQIVRAKQWDALSRFLDVTLLNDHGSAIDLTDCRVQFNAEKADGTNIMNNAVITDAVKGQFTIELTDQALAIGDSVLRSDITVFSNDATVLLTTRTFMVQIQSTMRDDEAVESSNEYNAVVTLFQNVWDMREVIRDMNEKQGQLTDDLPNEWGNEQAGTSMFGALNKIWNYLKTQSTAGIVDLINQINAVLGIANPTVEGTDTAMNYLLKIFKKADSVNSQVFLAGGTFSVPTGITRIYVTACGGGGGARARTGATPSAGSGGSTVIGNLITLPGGSGANAASGGLSGGAGGGAGGDAGAAGANGLAGCGGTYASGGGGGGSLGGGGNSGDPGTGSGASLFGTATHGHGSFGGGAGSAGFGGGGGGAAIYKRVFTVTPGQNIAITIGAGGAAGGSAGGYHRGGTGIAIIEW